MNSSNLTNATNSTYSEDYHVYFMVEAFSIMILFVLAIATVISNGVFLFTYYKDPLQCLRTPSAIFIAGLTSANFLTGLIVEPAYVVFYLWAYTSDSEDLWKFLRFAQAFSFFTMNASFLIMLGLGIIQYLLINSPRIYDKFVSPKSARIGVVFIWIYAIFFALLPEIFDVDDFAYILTDLILHVTLLTIALLILYIAIYFQFRKLAERHRNADLGENAGQEGLSAEATESEQRRRQAEKDFVYGTLILTAMLIITVWPFCITLALVLFNFTLNGYIALMIAQLFLLWKFAMDPFVFAWRLRKFRKSLILAMQRTCCCPNPSLLGATYIRQDEVPSPKPEDDDDDMEVTVIENREQDHGANA